MRIIKMYRKHFTKDCGMIAYWLLHLRGKGKDSSSSLGDAVAARAAGLTRYGSYPSNRA